MDTEILVHIKAPSRFVDDRRYTAIAQGVLDFKPTKLTRVLDDCVGQYDMHNPSLSLLTSTISGNKKSISIRKFRKVEETNNRTLEAAVSNTKAQCLNVHRSIKNPQVTRRRKVQSIINNPPYKSPLRKRCYTESDLDYSCITPDAILPFAPVESGAQIMVPNTDQRALKRTPANTLNSSFESLVIANSQPAHLSITTPSSSRQLISSIPSEHVLKKLSSGKTTLEVATNAPLLHPTVTSSGQPQLSFTDLIPKNSPNPLKSLTSVLLPRPKNITLEDQHGTEHESGPSCEAAEDESTLTIPDQSLSPHGHPNQVADDLQLVVQASLVNLISPEDSADGGCRQPKHGTQVFTRGVPQLIPCGNASSKIINPDLSANQCIGLALEALPLVINGPDPTVDELAMPSYETPILKTTAEALGFPKRFKPEKVSRGISRRERGYWSVPITITNRETLRPIEGQVDTKQKDKQDYTWRPLLKYDSLTEAEFLEIWKELERFISSGNSGWSIKVVRRRFSTIQNEDGIHEGFRFYLHIYCYGEAIPYVYAMLLICTRMYILCKPLEWISTLDEQVVVTMTGDESRKGDLGEWAQHRNGQGKIYWNCR